MTSDSLRSIAEDLRAILDRLPSNTKDLEENGQRRAREDLERIADELRARLTVLDPVRQPDALFDPADPRLFGIFAALALVGQDRQSLSSIAENKFYGSGVYAIYYKGPFKTYERISGTEHPIYVGKADPAIQNARTPREQGSRLHGRLNEHRKNIDRAENLAIDDFECRYLVVATGWQTAAESALIGLFRPLWNKETGILLGFGKHGDSADTRRNTRSPWDVLHAGRSWAAANTIEDRKSPAEIEVQVRSHFNAHAPVPDIEHIVRELTIHVRSRR